MKGNVFIKRPVMAISISVLILAIRAYFALHAAGGAIS